MTHYPYIPGMAHFPAQKRRPIQRERRSLLYQIRNDGGRVGHDVDGVVRLAFFGKLGLGELPCFFCGSHRDLAGLLDGFEIFFSGDQVNRIAVGHAEEVECDEEGDGEFAAQVFFHRFLCIVAEAAHVFRRFHDVVSSHDGDDDASVLGSHTGRIVAFASLVEGDVFRIPPGAGKAHVGFFFERRFLDVIDDLRAGEPCFIGIAAYHGADFAFRIDDGMDQEARLDHVACFLHVVRDGVVVQLGGAGQRIDAVAEVVCQSVAVVDLDGVPAGHAGEDELAAAAVAGEEVDGDAVDDDDLVRFHYVPVQPDRCAPGGVACVDEIFLVPAVMLVEADPASHFLTDYADIFFVGLGEEDADITVRDAGAVQLIHDMDNVLFGMVPRAGHVGADDAYLVAGLHLVCQRGGADGMAHAVKRCLLYVHGRRGAPFDDGGNMFLRQLAGLCSFSKSECKCFHSHRWSSFALVGNFIASSDSCMSL